MDDAMRFPSERQPFMGAMTRPDARNVPVGYAKACNNVVTRDGHLKRRPAVSTWKDEFGTLVLNQDTTLPNAIRSALHVPRGREWFVATTTDGAYLVPYDADLELVDWTPAVVDRGYGTGSGALYRHGDDVYSALDRVCVSRGAIDNVHIRAAGMESLPDTVTITATLTASASDHINGTGLKLWFSRYNAVTGIESNAYPPEGTDVTGTGSADWIEIDITDIPSDLIGLATHIRIYASRDDGLGYPGLLAEVEYDADLSSTFSYDLGRNADEANGGTTYAEGDDMTDYEYAPPTMNGLPPENTVAMVFHEARMFYATRDGLVFFSQSTEENQGSVESVAADSFRAIPQGERPVALIEYRDSVYVLTNQQAHRLAGSVNSLTNQQVVQGVLADEIQSTDILMPVEGSVGCYSRDSVIEVEGPGGGLVYWTGQNNAYVFDGVNCVPLAEPVLDNYLNRIAEDGEEVCRDEISAAHYKTLDLILWCFKDQGIMAWDYVRKTWVLWDTFQSGSTGALYAAVLGPVITYAPRGEAVGEPFFFRETGPTTDESLMYQFVEGTNLDNDTWNIAPTWTCGDHDLGFGDREKWFHHLTVAFEQESTTGAKAYVFMDGQSTRQLPSSPPTFWATGNSWKVDIKFPLGYRGKSCQPKFELGTCRVLGYAIDGDVVGLR